MNGDILVSVIVPVYNSAPNLVTCINSLLEQTIQQDKMEIILIDDGSVDDSLDICRKYNEKYRNINVIASKHMGVSSARNLGIKKARGRFLMFLDSDDTLENDTVIEVTDFFLKHYEETDIVTYPEETIIAGVRKKPHTRYKFFRKDKVYDLNKTPYAVQTRIGICVKRKDILFDESLFFHEDQKYIMKMVNEKMNMGFCTKGKYYWRRRSGSTMQTCLKPEIIFESTIAMYEDIFSWNRVLPLYYQAMILHDINWKFNSRVLIPYEFNKIKLICLLGRLRKLICMIEIEMIEKHPTMSDRTKKFIYSIKKGEFKDIIKGGFKEQEGFIRYYENGSFLTGTHMFNGIFHTFDENGNLISEPFDLPIGKNERAPVIIKDG